MGEAVEPGRRRRLGTLLALLTCSHGVTFASHNVLGVLLVDLGREFELGVPIVAQVVAAMGLTWGLAAPLIGPLSDRFGRRPVFFSGQALLALSSLATALAWNFTSLVGLRVLGALGGAAVGPSTYAIIADVVPPAERGRAIGWVSLGFSLATMALVPALAVLAAAAGWRWVFLALGLAHLAIILVGWRLAPRAGPAPVGFDYRAQLRSATREPAVLALLVGNVTQQAGAVAVITFVPAFLIQTFGLGLVELAPLLMLIAGGTLVGTLVGGQLADRTDRVSLSIQLLAFAGLAGAALFLLTPLLWVATALAALQAVARAAYNPPYGAMISSVAPRLRGTVLGLSAATNNLGAALGSAGGGLALAAGGYPTIGLLVVGFGLAGAAAFWLGRPALTGLGRAAPAEAD